MARKSFIQTLKDIRRMQHMACPDLMTLVQKRLPLPATRQVLEFYRNHMTDGKVLLVADLQEISTDI